MPTGEKRNQTELPGSHCPRCGVRGRCIHLRHIDGEDAAVVRTFIAKCKCKSKDDPSKPLRWQASAPQHSATVVGTS
jgi:hypothetical protein